MATKQEIIGRIEIMQAWVDGEEVEYEDQDAQWCEMPYKDVAEFVFDRANYRIKPKPREVWIRNGGLFYSKGEADKYGDNAVLYREVIEDE